MFLYLRTVPGFWTAIEERDRPILRSFPLILGGLPSQRGMVREVNLLAGQRGIRPGMSLAQAQQLCPDGTFLVPDIPRYEGDWEGVCDIVRTYTPAVEPLEMGQVVCDLAGCERLWGDERSIAREILTNIREQIGIQLWIGIGANRLVAQLASTIGGTDGITMIETGQERPFLANLPITMLPEVDPRLALTFEALGLRTIGQFAALSPAAVAARFGAAGRQIHRYARGIDPRPVTPPAARQSIMARRECDDGSFEDALARLHDLAEDCANRLQQRELAGRLIALRLCWANEAPRERIPAPAAALSEQELTRAALPVMENASSPAVPHPHPGSQATATLPVPYRIHSMLPQPGQGLPRKEPELPVPADEEVLPARAGSRTVDREMMAVREPISSADALFQKARQLLVQSWRQAMQGGQRPPHLLSLQLEVSEFQEPVQLSIDGLTGELGGSISMRHRLVAEQDRILTARYGDEPFRHVTRVDPASILTERRFQWRPGLPWKESPAGKRTGAPRRSSRRRRA